MKIFTMNPEIFENIIKCINQFVDFKEEELIAMQNNIEIIQLKKNDIFIQEGEIANRIAFTNAGYLRVYYYYDGEEITRDITPLHSFVTALPSFVSQSIPRPTLPNISSTVVVIVPPGIGTRTLDSPT